ncbi:MAG: SDR family oxidoreductase [Pseudoxanthomonas sp.]
MGIERVLERFSLAGRRAVITDIGRGPAQEVAPLLADAGATIVVVNPDKVLAVELAGRIQADCGKAAALPCELADETAVQDLFAQVDALHGAPDILVNCAALTLNHPFAETSLEQLDIQFSANLRAPFLLMREAVKRMVAAGKGGRIVNISTMGAEHPVLSGNAIYSASRAALNMMCRNIAHDHLGDRIFVNAVLPGAFSGKVTMHEDTLARIKAGHAVTGPVMQPGRMPLGYGDPWDIASAVLYLVGPSGGFITGQTITLDGGFLLT